MKNLKSIEEEKQDCIDAWEAFPATWAWMCHHEILVEPLTEYFMYRVNYITRHKPLNEQAVRFRNFRPVKNVEGVKSAQEAYDAAFKPAREAFDAAVKPAQEAYDAAVKPAQEAYDAAVKSQLDSEWEGNSWNGISIF